MSQSAEGTAGAAALAIPKARRTRRESNRREKRRMSSAILEHNCLLLRTLRRALRRSRSSAPADPREAAAMESLRARPLGKAERARVGPLRRCYDKAC